MYAFLLVNFHFPFLEDQRRPHNTLPDVLDIFHHGLEMRGGVVGASDEDVVLGARRGRRVQR